jgi:hypothetical protein
MSVISPNLPLSWIVMATILRSSPPSPFANKLRMLPQRSESVLARSTSGYRVEHNRRS